MSGLIFLPSFHERIATEPFIVVDIGARGGLQEPWRTLDTVWGVPLKVVAFEPDVEACRDLQKRYGDKHLVAPLALWHEKGEIVFHSIGATSSVHRPNLDHLKQFEERNWACRTGFVEHKVPCDTLDNVMREHGLNADFIKCDTQGSEYEIFEGAAQQLRNHACGVVAETWTVEVHAGQKLGFEVDKQCHMAGFELVLKQVRGKWIRNYDRSLAQRPQETQHDALYFKQPDALFAQQDCSAAKIMKAAAIAEYFGFTGYACDVLSKAMASDDAQFIAARADMEWCYSIILKQNRPDLLEKALRSAAAILRKCDRMLRALSKHRNLIRRL